MIHQQHTGVADDANAGWAFTAPRGNAGETGHADKAHKVDQVGERAFSMYDPLNQRVNICYNKTIDYVRPLGTRRWTRRSLTRIRAGPSSAALSGTALYSGSGGPSAAASGNDRAQKP